MRKADGPAGVADFASFPRQHPNSVAGAGASGSANPAQCCQPEPSILDTSGPTGEHLAPAVGLRQQFGKRLPTSV